MKLNENKIKVGDKVICLDSEISNDPTKIDSILGRVYTVKDFYYGTESILVLDCHPYEFEKGKSIVGRLASCYKKYIALPKQEELDT